MRRFSARRAWRHLQFQDPDGATALVIAIINAHYEFAEMLIEAGTDPNIGDNEAGMAALYATVDMHRLAVGHGRGTPPAVGLLTAVDIARAPLEHGADPNATRTHTMGDTTLGEGATPLMRAAKSGDIELVRRLLEHGADTQTENQREQTPLALAQQRSTDVIIALVEAGAGSHAPTRQMGPARP